MEDAIETIRKLLIVGTFRDLGAGEVKSGVGILHQMRYLLSKYRIFFFRGRSLRHDTVEKLRFSSHHEMPVLRIMRCHACQSTSSGCFCNPAPLYRIPDRTSAPRVPTSGCGPNTFWAYATILALHREHPGRGEPEARTLTYAYHVHLLVPLPPLISRSAKQQTPRTSCANPNKPLPVKCSPTPQSQSHMRPMGPPHMG